VGRGDWPSAADAAGEAPSREAWSAPATRRITLSPRSNPALTAGLSLQISQPLLRNFGRVPTELNIETARNTRDASYETFIRSVQTVVNAVEQSYWDLVYARANLAVKIEARDIARELNRITKIKIDVGSLAPIDIVQTEVGIATAEQDIINAEAVVGLAEDGLRRNLNYQAATPTTTTIVPTDKLAVERQPFDLAEGVTTALQRRPEIAAQNPPSPPTSCAGNSGRTRRSRSSTSWRATGRTGSGARSSTRM
jgi:outer membrane protein TolC